MTFLEHFSSQEQAILLKMIVDSFFIGLFYFLLNQNYSWYMKKIFEIGIYFNKGSIAGGIVAFVYSRVGDMTTFVETAPQQSVMVITLALIIAILFHLHYVVNIIYTIFRMFVRYNFINNATFKKIVIKYIFKKNIFKETFLEIIELPEEKIEGLQNVKR